MNFLAPTSFALSALSIPIFLLYMLRLRRTEMTISSNFLWQQLVRDREANAPWQRLRFSWLLFLQLLILALLMLALARPFVEVETVSSGRIVLLLDASASMAATDVDEASRFAQAQAEALDIVETLGNDDTMTIIRVAEVPEVLIAESQNESELSSAIREAEVGETRADWRAAFELAAARAQGAETFNVVVVSDGGITGSIREIPGEIRFVNVGTSAENVAITALATDAIAGEGLQLFAQLTNFGTETAEIIFSINLDGELYDAQRYEIDADRRADIILPNLPDSFDVLEANISLPSSGNYAEYLSTDNQAYAVRNIVGAGDVLLVTPRNIFLSQVFNSVPGFELTQTTPESGLPAGDFDLYVFDGWLPSALPDGDMLIINPPNSTTLFSVGDQINDINQTTVTTVLPDDPRTQYLDMSEVNISTFRPITPIGDWADVLVDSVGGALLLAGESDNRQIAILSFALQDSDLPLQIAYPVMMTNLMRWYTPARVLNLTSDSIAPGSALTMQPLDGNEIRITTPDGETESFELSDENPQLAFANTQQKGVYTVEVLQDGDSIAEESFAVNLFDTAESNITPQESVTIGNAEIGEASRDEVGQFELWQYIALFGLAVLLFEWIYYHRTGLRQLRTQISRS